MSQTKSKEQMRKVKYGGLMVFTIKLHEWQAIPSLSVYNAACVALEL